MSSEKGPPYFSHIDLLTVPELFNDTQEHTMNFNMQHNDPIEAYPLNHYCDVTVSDMASQITGISIVYSTVCSGIHKKNIKTL